MECIEDWTLEEPLEGECQVLNSEDERIVVDESAQAHPVVLELNCVVVEVEFFVV